MKAMILAAGLGTRLRPITDTRPKALVEVAGRTLLEITLTRLRAFGIREVIVNVHHYADMIIEYLQENDNFGIEVEISREETLLDTGGGLKKAAWYFLDSSDEPFILHNVDVISTIDLHQMVRFHKENRALATLAVQDRKTSRYLIFDEQFQLCGRKLEKEQKTEIVRSSRQAQQVAFSGIHVISPQIFGIMTEEGVFSIITSYLDLAARGEKILAFRTDGFYWRDLGRLDDITQAAHDMKQGSL